MGGAVDPARWAEVAQTGCGGNIKNTLLLSPIRRSERAIPGSPNAKSRRSRYCDKRGPGMWLPGTLAELGVVMLPVDLVVNPALISFGIPMMAASRRATSMSRWTWSERPQRRLTHARGSARIAGRGRIVGPGQHSRAHKRPTASHTNGGTRATSESGHAVDRQAGWFLSFFVCDLGPPHGGTVRAHRRGGTGRSPNTQELIPWQRRAQPRRRQRPAPHPHSGPSALGRVSVSTWAAAGANS